MDLKKREDILKFQEEEELSEVEYEDTDPISLALDEEYINFIFELIKKATDKPLIYENGCGKGHATAQIVNILKKKEIDKYKLIANDAREGKVKHSENRFVGNKKVSIELRSDFDFTGVGDESVDAIFFRNTNPKVTNNNKHFIMSICIFFHAGFQGEGSFGWHSLDCIGDKVYKSLNKFFAFACNSG